MPLPPPPRTFATDDLAKLLAGDLVTCDDGMHWVVVERLNSFEVFVLKSKLTGEKVMAWPSKYYGIECLAEKQGPERNHREFRSKQRRQLSLVA